MKPHRPILIPGSDRAFTLVELLVVMVIISLVVALAGPAGYHVFDKTKTYLARIESSQFKKKTMFRAFIMDKDGEVTSKEDMSFMMCDGKVVLKQPNPAPSAAVGYHITNKGYLLDLP